MNPVMAHLGGTGQSLTLPTLEMSSVTVQVGGDWRGTLLSEVSVAGVIAPLLLTPMTGGIPFGSEPIVWTAPVEGADWVRVRCAQWSSGQAVVTLTGQQDAEPVADHVSAVATPPRRRFADLWHRVTRG